jgi:hypothetical protein
MVAASALTRQPFPKTERNDKVTAIEPTNKGGKTDEQTHDPSSSDRGAGACGL